MSLTFRAAILIPAYNAASTIAQTLQSVAACPGISEIGAVYLCDDASSDDTVQEALRCWSGAIELKVMRNERNMGERRTVNSAMKILGGQFDWVFLLHADDVVKDNWLELYFTRMQTASMNLASICSSYDGWFSDSDKIVPGSDELSRDVEIIPGSRESILGTLHHGCWWHISGCAIRTTAFTAVGDFRPDMPQFGDFEWLLRCLKKGYSIEYIPRTTMLYRMHAKSVSSSSFNSGRDLAERLLLYGQYFEDGYIERGRWQSVRLEIAYSAVKRIIKQGLKGEFGRIRSLIEVCQHALRFRRGDVGE